MSSMCAPPGLMVGDFITSETTVLVSTTPYTLVAPQSPNRVTLVFCVSSHGPVTFTTVPGGFSGNDSTLTVGMLSYIVMPYYQWGPLIGLEWYAYADNATQNLTVFQVIYQPQQRS